MKRLRSVQTVTASNYMRKIDVFRNLDPDEVMDAFLKGCEQSVYAGHEVKDINVMLIEDSKGPFVRVEFRSPDFTPICTSDPNHVIWVIISTMREWTDPAAYARELNRTITKYHQAKLTTDYIRDLDYANERVNEIIEGIEKLEDKYNMCINYNIRALDDGSGVHIFYDSVKSIEGYEVEKVGKDYQVTLDNGNAVFIGGFFCQVSFPFDKYPVPRVLRWLDSVFRDIHSGTMARIAAGYEED
jgi:hypothetical protein